MSSDFDYFQKGLFYLEDYCAEYKHIWNAV